jgi:hypothetical protein
MKKVGFLVIIIIFLFILDIVLILKQFKMREQIKETAELIKDDQLSNLKFIQNLKSQIELGFSASISTFKCLKSYSTTGPKIVLFIPENVCNSCLNELLGYLDQLIDSIGEDKILLLGNFKIEDDFLEYVKLTSRIIKEHVNCRNIILSKDLNGQPILFVLNSEKEIHFFYIPNYLSEFKEVYFTKLLPSYFNQK